MQKDKLKNEINNANVLLCEGLFGTYRIPLDPNKTATYTCPANINMKERVIRTLSK